MTRRCVGCGEYEDDVEGRGCIMGWHDPHHFVEVAEDAEES